MTARREYNSLTGFTLIEIIVLLLVAAIILPALILPFREAVRDLGKPVIAGNLALLAQEEMEKKVVCWTDLADVIAWDSAPLPAPFADYSSEGIVDPDVAFGPVQTGMKQVTVTVTHSSGQSLSLVTVKSNWRKESQ